MMNNEDLEQKMAFVVNQQAQFAVDIEKLHEAQHLTEQKLSEANEMVTRLAYVTNVGFKDVNAKINALVDSQIRTDDIVKNLAESQKRTDENLNAKFYELAESQKRTDENLNAKFYELAESQKRTDEKLNAKFYELAESQKRTELTLNAKFSELAEFQKRTDRSINELTESQKKTDEEFRKLITRLDRRSKNGGNTS
jgi:hypothetical protein